MRIQGIRLVLLVASLTAPVFAAPARAAEEASGNLNGDWPRQVQEWLMHAAIKGQKWQSQRTTIERHIENIGYLLQSASLTVRTADYAMAEVNLHHAIKMLDRGVARGFYRRSDAEPLKLIIAQQLPNIVRYDTGSVPQEGR